MQTHLDGRTLVWLSWDERGVFTAATRQMLLEHYAAMPVKLQLVHPPSIDELPQFAQRHFASLVTLVIGQQSEIAAACKTFVRLRGGLDQPVCVAFLDAELLENVGLLLEAGAQVVVSQLPSWQRTLSRVLAIAPLSKRGFHPLTSGLIDRLPWPQI
jgi:hypothetical protein